MTLDAAVAVVLVAVIILLTIRSLWRARCRWTALPPCQDDEEPWRDPRTDGLS